MLEIIIPLALAAAQIAAAIYIVFLTFTEILTWFRNNRRLTQNDIREVGFTLQKRLDNGDYSIIQGVFNEGTETVTSARKVNTSSLDSRLAGYHQINDLAIYT